MPRTSRSPHPVSRRHKATETSTTIEGTETAGNPNDHPAHEVVLLAVTGMSPAILTETIWALAHEQPPVVPDRVVVITTRRGRDQIEALLFTPRAELGDRSAWQCLRAGLESLDLDLSDRLRFGTTANDVRVIATVDPADMRSSELADIRSPADNEAAADFILEQVRAIVENPDTALVASLAGGRKTMGALLYACMTLIGRDHDRLTHVLVNEPFETLPGFFFPAQPGPALTDRSGATHLPSDARVELADVPFVPLRHLFDRDLGRRPGTFLRLVDQCRGSVRRRLADDIRLEVDPRRGGIQVNGQWVPLSPTEMLLVMFLADRARQKAPAHGSYKEAIDDLEQFRLEQRELPATAGANWRHAAALACVVDERAITRPLSSLKDKLRRAGAAAVTLIDCLPEKGRCSLEVPAALIHIRP